MKEEPYPLNRKKMTTLFQDRGLAEIADKVFDERRLSKEDGMVLMNSNNILFLGYLARYVNERKNKNLVFFNVNRHINLTNICISRCKFCAFSRDREDTDAYTMSIDQVVQDALDAVPLGITELHVVSGLHPDLPFDYYIEVIKRLKEALPNVHIQAFTAVEIHYFSEISGLSIEEVLKALKNAGLGSLPGGGAEIFNPEIRSRICPRKASGIEWLQVMRTAHHLGFKSNATMLYGHIETLEDRIDHLLTLRELQDETHGFQSFIPLSFHPLHTALSDIQKPSAFEDLKMLAIARLMLDNFNHIKAFWIMTGLNVSQLSIDFGVDDLDGTIVEEKITHAAGAKTEKSIEKNELIRLIKEMGRVPVERDTLYNKINIYQ
ncbi:MAG: aminofutalosine synthase MqnE [Thermodesulfobacteriota bacterium]|nr:aminofutalosine synthase MqnE [Thermodesulfobacteriota bacterium]